MSSAAGEATAAAAAAAAGGSATYWCSRCCRFVRVMARGALVCPECDPGFVEGAETPPQISSSSAGAGGLATDVPNGTSSPDASPRRRRHHDLGFRRGRRTSAVDRSPFNPVIVLRGPAESGDDGGVADGAAGAFELYYDEGAGAGLRPLPASVSDFLMGAGFDRLLDQLTQIDINGLGGRWCDQPPASKAAVESMPTIEISESFVNLDSHCAVCKEPFEMGTEAREMPCKHIYHHGCILPWLSLRNSCPVCRHEMPADVPVGRAPQEAVDGGEEDALGLTIWRLPGGGFAVGRFSGGRRAGERVLPLVYTEMDGGFNASGGAPRRISWTSRSSRTRQSGRVRRALGRFFSFFGRLRWPSSPRTSHDGTLEEAR